ncbi:MAG: hypothetical protein B7Z02_04960 [Rhodobacterales bacterium 32-67-9]|nr:MAG: hypothetical protein B7Z02_04960 [Rhodobacterales bacterium 32-67-9]
MTTATSNAKPRRTEPSTTHAKRVTKKDQLIRMLGTASGADVATISSKLGWQAHTVQAALTGLRKAGHAVTAEKPGQGKPSRYRIHAAPAPVEPAATATTGPRDVPHAG